MTVRLIGHLMRADLATLTTEKIGALHGRIQRSVVGFVRFLRIGLLEFLPAVLTGFALAFARAIGEYGSIVFISGNLPFKTEIAPQLIVMRLEEYDYTGAIALAVVLLVFSFILLAAINLLEQWSSKFQH